MIVYLLVDRILYGILLESAFYSIIQFPWDPVAVKNPSDHPWNDRQSDIQCRFYVYWGKNTKCAIIVIMEIACS